MNYFKHSGSDDHDHDGGDDDDDDTDDELIDPFLMDDVDDEDVNSFMDDLNRRTQDSKERAAKRSTWWFWAIVVGLFCVFAVLVTIVLVRLWKHKQ